MAKKRSLYVCETDILIAFLGLVYLDLGISCYITQMLVFYTGSIGGNVHQVSVFPFYMTDFD